MNTTRTESFFLLLNILKSNKKKECLIKKLIFPFFNYIQPKRMVKKVRNVYYYQGMKTISLYIYKRYGSDCDVGAFARVICSVPQLTYELFYPN